MRLNKKLEDFIIELGDYGLKDRGSFVINLNSIDDAETSFNITFKNFEQDN